MRRLNAVAFITHADRDLFETGKNIQFCQRNSVYAVDSYRVFESYKIEPAASSGPSGSGAELGPPCAESLSWPFRVFSGERPFSDTSAVGLDDTRNPADKRWPYSCAHRAAARYRAGTCHVGVGSVVEIEKGPLSTLKKNIAPGFDGFMYDK